MKWPPGAKLTVEVSGALRIWAILGGLVGLMMLPAIRRRTMVGLVRMPLFGNFVIRSELRNRRLRNLLMRQALRPVLKAQR